jgi:hypothetical protein
MMQGSKEREQFLMFQLDPLLRFSMRRKRAKSLQKPP